MNRLFLLLLLASPLPPVPTGNEGEPTPAPAPDIVAWRSIEAGEAESRETRRPVLYLFTADWCPACEALKSTVFSDPAVAELIERTYVPVEVNDVLDQNQRSSPEVEALKFKFLVAGLPSLVVSRPDGGPAVSETAVPVHSKVVRFLRSAPGQLAARERAYRTRSGR